MTQPPDGLGTLLHSRDPRDERTVRVIEIHPDRVRVENTATQRRTFIRLPINPRSWRVEPPPDPRSRDDQAGKLGLYGADPVTGWDHLLREYSRCREVVQWLVELDAPHMADARRHITLTEILQRARAALNHTESA